MDLWREIWTDGRALPAAVGGRSKDTHDPKYTATRSAAGKMTTPSWWKQRASRRRPGRPRAAIPTALNAHVVERFHRSSKNDLSLRPHHDGPEDLHRTVLYGGSVFPVGSEQQLDDFTCIPSEQQLYLREMGDPAGSDPDAATQGGRGGRP